MAAERLLYAARLAAKFARVARAQLSLPVACQACSRDGQAYCLTLKAEKLGATESAGKTIVPITKPTTLRVTDPKKGEA